MITSWFVLLSLFGSFSAVRTEYDEDLAKRLVYMASAPYGLKANECVKRTLSPDKQLYLYADLAVSCDFVGSACRSLIAVSNVSKEVIIAFRGTKKMPQLISITLTSQLKGEDFHGMGSVAPYFRNGHEIFWPKIKAFFAHPEFKDYKVYLTGHSLGGVLASLTAARIVKEGIRSGPSLDLITFGQPRTGSYKFAQSFDALKINSYRIVHRTDLVPHFPECDKDHSAKPNSLGVLPCYAHPSNRAYHHSTEIWYPVNMTGSPYMVCDGTPKNEDMNCSDALILQARHMSGYRLRHRIYFGVEISRRFGKSGCVDRSTEEYVPGGFMGEFLKKVESAWKGFKKLCQESLFC